VVAVAEGTPVKHAATTHIAMSVPAIGKGQQFIVGVSTEARSGREAFDALFSHNAEDTSNNGEALVEIDQIAFRFND
jgi:hypothetical protein